MEPHEPATIVNNSKSISPKVIISLGVIAAFLLVAVTFPFLRDNVFSTLFPRDISDAGSDEGAPSCEEGDWATDRGLISGGGVVEDDDGVPYFDPSGDTFTVEVPSNNTAVKVVCHDCDHYDNDGSKGWQISWEGGSFEAKTSNNQWGSWEVNIVGPNEILFDGGGDSDGGNVCIVEDELPAPSPTPEPTPTDEPEPSNTPTHTPTMTPTATLTPSPTPTTTPTPTLTPTPTATPEPSPTIGGPGPSLTPTPTPSLTPTPTPTVTPTPTLSPTPTGEPEPTPTSPPDATPTPTPQPEMVCVGDRVVHDINQNNRQNSGEPGIKDIVVKLYDEDGNLVSSTNTDNDGYYSFCNLQAGTYHIGFEFPEGYTSSDKDEGADDELDCDANPLTGKTDEFILRSGQNDYNWDACLYMEEVEALPDTGVFENTLILVAFMGLTLVGGTLLLKTS